MKRRNAIYPLTFFLLFLAFLLLFLVFLNANPVAPEWSDDKPLITLLSFDGASSITQTSDRKIWVVWQRETSSGHAIFYSTSSDYGASWSQEKNLTNILNLDQNVDPSITQLSNGTIWVVWSALKKPPLPESDFEMTASPASLSIPQGSSDTSIITVTSLNGFNDQVNLTVRSIFPISPFITTNLDPTQVTPPPYGEANSTLTINVGTETTPQDYWIMVKGYSERQDITHTVNVVLTVTTATGSSTSASSDTKLLSTSTSSENYELYYKVSHDNGTSWSNEMKLTEDSADDLGPSILQASNGTIWCVWSSSRTGNNEIFYKTSSDFGASWSADTPLTFNASSDIRPAIAQMQNERIWVAWHSLRYVTEGNEEILYKIYNGSSWTNTYRLTNHTNMDTSPAILQAADGTIRIFWASSGTGEEDTWDIYYKESHDNGDNWSDRIQLTTDINDDLWPAVTQSVDTRIWVTWTTNRTGSWDIFYRTSRVHNIAVTNVAAAPTQVYEEENVTIDVTVHNYGDYNETFTVNCYADSTPIHTQNVNLNSRESTIITFKWNTSGFASGNYRIKANASTVENEAYTADNTYVDGTVTVLNRLPVANFTESAETVLTGETIYFNASDSYDPDGTIVSYFWDFGDETNDTGVFVNHAYADDGFYTVNLTVTDDDGATASTNATKTILNRPPVAIFTESAETVNTRETILFNATQSYDPDGTIVTYFWDFGDGTNSTGVIMNHAYVDDGIYIVILNVTDNDDASNSTSATKTVLNIPPVGGFTYSPPNPFTNEPVTFDASTSHDPDGYIVSYFWDFGDDTNATSKTVTHAYSAAGTYDVTLTVTDDDGATDNTTATVPVVDLDFVRDVAIVDVVLSATEAYPTWMVPLNITVVAQNQGERTETFDVTVYYNMTAIGTQTVTLAQGANTTLIFSWNLLGVAEGTYTIRAEASVLFGETDIVDNSMIDGTVKLKYPGDANDDGTVNVYDLNILAKALGTSVGDPNYDRRADFNGDGVIDDYDLEILQLYWGP